jgi:hypothetical protein
MPKAKQSDREAAKKRRDFLKKASALGAMLGTSGLAGLAFAQTKAPVAPVAPVAPPQGSGDAKIVALRSLVTEAIDKGDMEAAIKKHQVRAKLSDKQLGILRSITNEDLKQIKLLTAKLAKAKQLDPGMINGVADTAW